jgi:hypothetical protein
MADSETLKLAAQATSTAVALVALYLTFRGERRSQLRFDLQLKQSEEQLKQQVKLSEKQLKLSDRIAKANVLPILRIVESAYVDKKALELENSGAGPAVDLKLTFSRGKHKSGDVVELFDDDFEREFTWDDFTDNITYMAAKSSETIIVLTKDGLLNQGFTERRAAALLDELEKQIDKVRVRVTYHDALGNLTEDEELKSGTP